ncbi:MULTISPECIES: hypothetical protein [Aphanizomenonaceae]|jgi:hypothetical protein|uniref:hypothetical protein n=1 Tax=Aphanizomenonaceae TaxID=1892259 RepID=UPI0004886191|nr:MULTISPECIES: hypothetical protein [Aphanizomenonaceae]MBE9258088.1 hypothetical protein [Dolichospermum sp. LEGE 00246]
MNNILRIGTLLRDRYQITELSSNHTGFGITYKVKDSHHPNQPIPTPPLPPAPQIPWKLILGTISGIIILIGVVMAVMSILPKSNDQLITDGKAKSGQLTSSDQKELSSDKNYDVYTFKSDKKQDLTVQIISNDFQPQLTMMKPDNKYFNPVSNVGTKRLFSPVKQTVMENLLLRLNTKTKHEI